MPLNVVFKSGLSSLAALATFALAQNASAEFIDFRQADDTGSINAAGDTWTSTEYGVEVTVTAGPAGSGNDLYWDDTDGFGVQGTGYEDDEVEGAERLVVSFDEEVTVVSIQVADLFQEGYGNSYSEHGWYSLDGGATKVSFSAEASGGNGEVALDVGVATSEIVFGAPGKEGWFVGSEFAVLGVTISDDGVVTAVPELSASGAAAAMTLLLGFGLLLVDRRRTGVVHFS